MNRVFKLIWSRSLGMLIPVPEVVRAVGHGGRRLSRRALQSVGLGALAALPPAGAYALPLGGNVSSGSASISTNAKTLTINQSSQKTIINWQSFSIEKGETVNFRQPGVSSVALNRVLGNNPSQIFGNLTANGQIFLVNPTGVLFGPGAQVDVGGLVASTLAITDKDFLAGNYQFEGVSTASVVNFGKIKAFNGGYVAFIGQNVDNEGRIVTPGGATVLGAGGSVALTLAGDSLLSFQVTTAALNASVKNGGAIVAPNGVVLLTAQAKNALLQTVVNNTGLIQANSATSNGGVVTLLGGATGSVADSGNISANSKSATGGSIVISGANVAVSGTARISATGATGGGTIAIGGGVHGGGNFPQALTTSVAAGAVVNASATKSGSGGTVSMWSDVTNPDSVTSVSGSIMARGAGQGAGGFVETSGHIINVNAATVQTAGGNGAAGTWLLDPYNVTIASNSASGTAFANTFTPTQASTILNSAIDSALNGGNSVIIQTGSGGSSNGNINVNAPITWSTAAGLTLNAYGNIEINAPITATSTTGTPALHLLYGQGSATGGTSSYTISAPVSLPSNASFTTKQGSSGTQVTYTVIDTQAQLQAVKTTGLAGDYALGANITGTGTFTSLQTFTGKFEGLGNTISNLTITVTLGNDQGLFGKASNATIRDIGLVNDTFHGSNNIGGLAGYCVNCTIIDSYATGTVSGGMFVGGLVATLNGGTIIDSYASVAVTGTNSVGGLVGVNDSSSTIIDSYATGAVTGTRRVGGLVGGNNGTITDVYATGRVTGSTNVGGLVGSNFGTITGGYWDTTTSGHANGVGSASQTGVTGLTTAALAAALPTGFTSSIWTNAGGKTTPYLIANEGFATVSGAVLLGTNSSATPTVYGVINNQTQLQNINKTGLSGNYVLANSITATGTFTPIGSSNTPFKGKFEGLGNTISNLTINDISDNHVGMFGYASNATISDLGLINESVTGPSAAQGFPSSTGGLVGDLKSGTITNSYVQGAVSGSGFQTGGLVGSNSGTITDSYKTGSVSGSGRLGGLVGINHGTINDSYATGVLSAGGRDGGLVGTNNGLITGSFSTSAIKGANYVGGLVGSNGGRITDSYATGAVTGSQFVGGLVGGGLGGSISNSYATGAVSGVTDVGGLYGFGGAGITASYATGAVTGTTTVGGLVGTNGGTIIDSYAAGTVSGVRNVGGLVGGNNSSGTITSSSATGTVTGSSSNIGGLVGSNAGKTTNSYATGSVSGNYSVGGLVGDNNNGTIADAYATGAATGNVTIGGLVGENDGKTTNSYATGSVSGNGSVGGLVGWNTGAAGYIYNSYAAGNTYATAADSGNYSVGGLVGHNNATISGAYATGQVTGATDIGGLVGSNSTNGAISDAYWDTATAGQATVGLGKNLNNSGAGVTGLSTSQWLTQGPVATGTFSANTWVSGYPYPVLKALPYILIAGNGTSQSYGSSIGAISISSVLNQNGSNEAGLVNTSGISWLSPGTVNVGSYDAGGSGVSAPAGYQLTYAASDTVTTKNLTITGVSGTAKTYDGSTTDTLSGTPVIGGLVGSQTVTLIGTLASANAGTEALTVSLGTGANGFIASNYTLTQPTLGAVTVSPATLTITGLSGTGRTYDGTTSDALTGTAVISGLVGTQTVSLVNAATGTLASANAGSEAVTTNITLADGANGGLAENYTLTQPTLDPITVSPEALTITGLAATDKTYDGTASDALTGTAVIAGLIGNQTVTLEDDTTGTLASANAGSEAVTTNITLADGANGGLAENYTLTAQPTLGAVTVSPAQLSITGLSGTGKTYDGTTSDALTGTAVITGLIGNETLTLGNDTTGTLSSANAGSEGVTTNITLADGANGGLAENYTLTQPTLGPITVSAAIDSTGTSTSVGGGSEGSNTEVTLGNGSNDSLPNNYVPTTQPTSAQSEIFPAIKVLAALTANLGYAPPSSMFGYLAQIGPSNAAITSRRAMAPLTFSAYGAGNGFTPITIIDGGVNKPGRKIARDKTRSHTPAIPPARQEDAAISHSFN